MGDSDNRNHQKTVSPSLQAPPQGESFRITCRASIATGRVKKSIDELGGFYWDVVSNIIQDALDEVTR